MYYVINLEGKGLENGNLLLLSVLKVFTKGMVGVQKTPNFDYVICTWKVENVNEGGK